MGGCEGVGRIGTWMWVDVRCWENRNLDVGGCEGVGRIGTWM